MLGLRGSRASLGAGIARTNPGSAPWPRPRVTPSPASPVPQFPSNVFLGLNEPEGSWDVDMSHIPAQELALRGQGEGRRVGMGSMGLGGLWHSLGGEWYPQGRIWDPPSGKGGLQSWCVGRGLALRRRMGVKKGWG